jgi:endonuclease YncB( thermonuclease family)
MSAALLAHPIGYSPARSQGTERAWVVRVKDADTLVLLVDVGYQAKVEIVVRIAYLDSPERGTPEGDAALAYVESVVRPGDPVLLRTLRTLADSERRSFERYVGSVTLVYDVAVQDFLGMVVTAGHGLQAKTVVP